MNISKRASYFIAVVSSVYHGASATRDVGIEVTNTLFNIMNVYDNCRDEVATLETCNGGHGDFTSCTDCAWTALLDGTVDPGCQHLLGDAGNDYSECTSCKNECEEELESMLTCAVNLYCSNAEQEQPVSSKCFMCYQRLYIAS